jgi:A/G-specific adenine glycosylase
MMLQQTQVDRVVPKYQAFLKQFPTVASLAAGSTSDVLKLWSGLGYNRRALYLKRAAEAVTKDFSGRFPKDAKTLETLPGVGSYTASAVATFSYDAPYVFIETNIRAVFLHFFFSDAAAVPDSDLLPFIERAMPKDGRYRDWYYALMDYGVYIKKSFSNPSRKSKHHVKQSKFEGSLRQIRGALLKACTEAGKVTKEALLTTYTAKARLRAETALLGLITDGFLFLDKKGYIKIRE